MIQSTLSGLPSAHPAPPSPTQFSNIPAIRRVNPLFCYWRPDGVSLSVWSVPAGTHFFMLWEVRLWLLLQR